MDLSHNLAIINEMLTSEELTPEERTHLEEQRDLIKKLRDESRAESEKRGLFQKMRDAIKNLMPEQKRSLHQKRNRAYNTVLNREQRRSMEQRLRRRKRREARRKRTLEWGKVKLQRSLKTAIVQAQKDGNWDRGVLVPCVGRRYEQVPLSELVDVANYQS